MKNILKITATTIVFVAFMVAYASFLGHVWPWVRDLTGIAGCLLLIFIINESD